MNAWSVTPNFDLPDGFSLREDTHVLFLVHSQKVVAMFSAIGVTPAAVLDACKQVKEGAVFYEV